jgi:hypothetical protein
MAGPSSLPSLNTVGGALEDRSMTSRLQMEHRPPDVLNKPSATADKARSSGLGLALEFSNSTQHNTLLRNVTQGLGLVRIP